MCRSASSLCTGHIYWIMSLSPAPPPPPAPHLRNSAQISASQTYPRRVIIVCRHLLGKWKYLATMYLEVCVV